MVIKEEQVQLLMHKLKISHDEAVQVLRYDDKVNKNLPTEYDLSPDKMKNVHNILRRVDHLKARGVKHLMKQNILKEETINTLVDFLSSNDIFNNIKITNKTREIAFSIGEKDYSLTLIEKRRPKK